MDLLNNIDGDQLAKIEPRVRLLDQFAGGGIDDIALLIAGEVANVELKNQRLGQNDPGHPYTYWSYVRTEIFKFVCTDDPKYAQLKTDVEKKGAQATTLILSVLSAAFANQLGTTSGVLVPFCALCLYGSLKVGKAAYCMRERELITKQGFK